MGAETEPVKESFIQRWGLQLFGFFQGLLCPDVMIALFSILQQSNWNVLLWIAVHLPVSIFVCAGAGFVLKLCTKLGRPGIATKFIFVFMCYSTLIIGALMVAKHMYPEELGFLPEIISGHSHAH